VRPPSPRFSRSYRTAWQGGPPAGAEKPPWGLNGPHVRDPRLFPIRAGPYLRMAGSRTKRPASARAAPREAAKKRAKGGHGGDAGDGGLAKAEKFLAKLAGVLRQNTDASDLTVRLATHGTP